MPRPGGAGHPALLGRILVCGQAPVAHPWLREVPEPHQPGPPKAEGNQKELARAKLMKERPRDPVTHCETPPGVGAQGPQRMEQGLETNQAADSPRAGLPEQEAPSTPLALKVVWLGCRLRRPQTPHLKHHAQEHQVPLTWHLCAPTPRQGYPGASDHSSLRTQGGWGVVAPVLSQLGWGQGRWRVFQPHQASPRLARTLGWGHLLWTCGKLRSRSGSRRLAACLVMN